MQTIVWNNNKKKKKNTGYVYKHLTPVTTTYFSLKKKNTILNLISLFVKFLVLYNKTLTPTTNTVAPNST